MHWSYKSKVGTFLIKPENDNQYSLWVNDEFLGSYVSPDQAADDVYMCATGYYAWDQQLTVIEPCDLTEWDRHGKG